MMSTQRLFDASLSISFPQKLCVYNHFWPRSRHQKAVALGSVNVFVTDFKPCDDPNRLNASICWNYPKQYQRFIFLDPEYIALVFTFVGTVWRSRQDRFSGNVYQLIDIGKYRESSW
jgi:hypothetical protein